MMAARKLPTALRKFPMLSTISEISCSWVGGTGDEAISVSSASCMTGTSADSKASVMAQLSRMPSRSMTKVRVPKISSGAVPSSTSPMSRFWAWGKVTSAEPAGIATVVPLGAASVAGSAPERHCEATWTCVEPATPSLERNPTWIT